MAVSILPLLPVAAQFAKDDEVQLKQDEPLSFNNSTYREGHKGEIFTVLAYRSDTRKLYLLATDSVGKPIALSVADSAVMIKRKDPEVIAAKAFEALRAGKLDQAQRLLEDAGKLEGAQELYTEAAAHIRDLTKAIADYQQGLIQQQREQSEIDRRRKNAAVMDRPNPLNPQDNSNRLRAADARREADEMEQRTKEGLNAAQSQIISELKLFDELAKKELAANNYSVALEITDMLSAISARYLSRNTRFEPSIAEYQRKDLQEKVSLAHDQLAKAKLAISVKKINEARRCIEEGLKSEPGSASLRQL